MSAACVDASIEVVDLLNLLARSVVATRALLQQVSVYRGTHQAMFRTSINASYLYAVCSAMLAEIHANRATSTAEPHNTFASQTLPEASHTTQVF